MMAKKRVTKGKSLSVKRKTSKKKKVSPPKTASSKSTQEEGVYTSTTTRNASGRRVKKSPGSPPKKKGSQGRQVRETANQWLRDQTKAARDIAPLPMDQINWERRLACERDLKLFSESYLPKVFYLGWSDDQLICVRKIESVFLEDGMFSLAMPRGGGKTALCRSGVIWGTAYGHKRLPFFVGSTQPKAIQTLDFIKTYWYMSKPLQEDFPELAYPIYRLENRFHLARGQTFNGKSTHISWGSDSITYPCLLLNETEVTPFLDKDPKSFIQWEDDPSLYYSRSAGVIINTAGIDGSIRGDAPVHPITLEQPRPDVVLLDDIQKDQKAESPAACEKMIRLIDGAIGGLSGPGYTPSALMPCTVIRENDVSDTYLNRMKKPEWKGERCQLVRSWPPGITDYEITEESEEGVLWNQYAELRIKSFNLYEDPRLANDHYQNNREKMDNGFIVTWPERYDPDKELSPQQHAMNLRLNAPTTFPSEYQNKGYRPDQGKTQFITSESFAKKTIDIGEGGVAADGTIVTCYVDIQNEILFYTVLAVSPTFTGLVTRYQAFPEVRAGMFTKNQTEGWSLLTKSFFTKYPHLRDEAVQTESGKTRAPLEAKIYNALSECIPFLSNLTFTRQDGALTELKIQKIGIDCQWGQVSDVIKRYCRECGIPNVVPCQGIHLPPTHRQFEEYTRGGSYKAWLFEDERNPQVKECKWVYKLDQSGQQILQIDASRMKDFVMSRISSPPGTSGCISLHSGKDHTMFATHVCDSEYPEPVTARGITKNVWKERDGRPDNDFLDTLCGAAALASMCGAYLPTNKVQKTTKQKRRSFSQMKREKRRA